MRMELYKRVFLNFALVISLSGILGGLLGAVMINRTTVNEAQRRVSLNLRSGWNVIENELDRLRLAATVLGGDLQVLRAFSPRSPNPRQLPWNPSEEKAVLTFFP